MNSEELHIPIAMSDAAASLFTVEWLQGLREADRFHLFTYYTIWHRRSTMIRSILTLFHSVIGGKVTIPSRAVTALCLSRLYESVFDRAMAITVCSRFLQKDGSPQVEEQLQRLLSGAVDAPASVSVIIPTYNRPELLHEALMSLTTQTFKAFEVIIVDNGTIDPGTIIREFEHRLDLRYVISDVQGSVSRAKNIGIAQARNRYVAFLDDDDWYHSTHLEVLVAELEKGEFRVAYTDAYVEFQEKMDGMFRTKKRFVFYSRDFNKMYLLVKDYIFTPCIMLDRRCFDVAGGFDENLKTDEDMDLWIRISKFYRFKHLKIVTCSVRITNAMSNLTKNWSLMYQNARYVYKKHRQLAGNNILVLLGQWYYLTLRKRRAKKYQNKEFTYQL